MKSKSVKDYEFLFEINVVCIIISIFGDNILELLTGIPSIPLKSYFFFFFTTVNLVKSPEWRKLCFSGPIFIWLILCVYADINGTVHGHLPWTSEEGDVVNNDINFFVFTLNIFTPFVVFVSSCWCYLYNKRSFLNVLLIAFIVYAIIVFSFDSIKDSGRFGQIAGNAGALRMYCAVIICVLAWNNKYIKSIQMAVVFSIAIALILAIQTRKTLVGVFIIIVFTYLSRVKFKKISSWIGLILSVFIIFLTISFILSNTEIGTRLMEVEDQGFEFNKSDIPALNILGDRSIHYYLGYFVWLDHPFFGVGYLNSPYYTNLHFLLHTEYWTQLVENGLIGFSLYILFLWSLMNPFFKHLLRQDNLHTRCVVCMGGIVSLMFVSIIAWTWTEAHYFMVFGVITAEGLIVRNQISDFKFIVTNKNALSKDNYLFNQN